MWYYAIDDQQQGPVSLDELKGMIARGELDSDSLVWQDGMNDWVPIGSIAELSAPASSRTDWMEQANPYSAMPMDLQDVDPLRRRVSGKMTQLKVAGGFLIAMAAFTLLLALPNVIVAFAMRPGNANAAQVAGDLVGRLLFVGVQILLQILTIAGGVALIRGRGIRLAWAGSIAAFIPLCGPCLGLSIPFAIWVVVLLLDPDVKNAFGTGTPSFEQVESPRNHF